MPSAYGSTASLDLSLTHDICLSTDGNETVDVLADRDQDLPGHVATLLGARSLVLDVDTSSTSLNEELGQLHDGSQPTMPSVGISDDGPQIVDVGNIATLRLGSRDTLLTLLSVVEQLGHEKVVDFVGDGVLALVSTAGEHDSAARAYHRVVGKIGGGLVGRGGSGRALPAGHINGVQVLGHLGDHCRLKAAIGEAGVFGLPYISTDVIPGVCRGPRTLKLFSRMPQSFLLCALEG